MWAAFAAALFFLSISDLKVQSQAIIQKIHQDKAKASLRKSAITVDGGDSPKKPKDVEHNEESEAKLSVDKKLESEIWLFFL